MKLSKRARYSLRMMVQFAKQDDLTIPLSLSKISKLTNISRRYLEHLIIGLKNSMFVRGVSGKGGGYLLAKAPEEIKVGHIIENTCGPINIVDCVLQPSACFKSSICECRGFYQLINKKITNILYITSLADIADKKLEKGLDEELGISKLTDAGNNINQIGSEACKEKKNVRRKKNR